MNYLSIPDLSLSPQTLPEHPFTFQLDPFQQHAISAIAKDENVLICAKTGSGKTLVGEYQIYHSLKKGKRVFYTTPIKSLSNQKFHDLKHQFKEASVGIMTGDIKFCPDAQIIVMTTEILRNLLYKKGSTTEHLGLTSSISIDDVDAVIFDECHYINDKDRGNIWEETMILLDPSINLVLLSATLDHPEYFAGWLGGIKKRQVHLIQTQYRIVPLTHNVFSRDYKLIELMDASEKYSVKTYMDWLCDRKQLEEDKRDYRKKVANARLGGIQGAIEGKVHTESFIHQMNHAIRVLETEGNLPALYFILSRKQCEKYANKVEGSLLSTSDTASVKNIINFHLHRHIKELEKTPQYHQIYNLLCRGIAFHHSGLLPLLKEIVELLFSKGFVKVMFCTETFAVGLNMPTKTVLFAGFKKYDEQTGGMRMLRTDEYIQMAGRAGRRGKDTRGIVIYLPDRDPVLPHELTAMITGSRPPITSRMSFHFDFILKTLQSKYIKWIDVMENSYWFQLHKKHIIKTQKEILDLENKIQTYILEDMYRQGCEQRDILESQHKQAINSVKKDFQRKIDILKNKQFGPKWAIAWKNYKELKPLRIQLHTAQEYLNSLERHQDTIIPNVQFLYEIGYLKTNIPTTLEYNDLTLKGILATEINEGHQILMTELYTQKIAHNIPGEELVAILACFLNESKQDDPISIHTLELPDNVLEVLKNIDKISREFLAHNSKICICDTKYWELKYDNVESIYKWIQGENASVICQEYGIFEGNFIRSVLKIGNLLDEWLSLATYCQHTAQIDKVLEVKTRLIRDIIISDSLYLHL